MGMKSEMFEKNNLEISEITGEIQTVADQRALLCDNSFQKR